MNNNRVVLDTNVILNTIFIPESTSRIAMKYLAKKGVNFYIDTNIINEAKLVFQKRTSENSIRFDGELDQFIRYFGVNEINRRIMSIKKDKHILTLAEEIDAEIITNDQELAYTCLKDGIDVSTPYMVILKSISNNEGLFNPGVEIFKSGGLNTKEGSIYICIDTSRICPSDKGYLADIEGAFSLQIDAEKVYLKDVMNNTLISASLKKTKLEVILLSYSANGVALRTRQCGEEMAYKSGIFDSITSDKKIWIGCNSHESGQPGLSFFSFIIKPTPIGRDSRRYYINQPQLRPNPYDEDRLDQYIK